MKANRLFAAVSLALLLVASAPVARAGDMDGPTGSPQTFAADFCECLSQAVMAGLGIVTSVL